MKEYKKVRTSIHIDNDPSFTKNLNDFLKKNPEAKIEHIITHKAYHVSIIYSHLEEIENDSNI